MDMDKEMKIVAIKKLSNTVVQIETDLNKIFCTTDHKLKTLRGWMPVDRLQKFDIILEG